MHSAFLRDSDFVLFENGGLASFQVLFRDVSKRTRVGVVAPNRVEGVGAINLILSFVTAFYDRYRADANDFFAYPDFFTFQQQSPVAHYSMLDIWPTHRNVFVGDTSSALANSIIDRGIDILLLPEGEKRPFQALDRIQLPAFQRLIRHCYLYSSTHEVSQPTLTIETNNQEIISWGTAVLDSLTAENDEAVQQTRQIWQAHVKSSAVLRQSFQKISLEKALLYLP